jgi:quercetin dioxygenase-like cupin family protein
LRHVRLGNGETITKEGRREIVLLAAHRELTITWSRYGAGERGPDLHVHREHTDAFYVLEGELTFAVGPDAELIQVPAGSYVAVPPNVVHTYVNDSSTGARWLNFHAADGGFAASLRARRDGGDDAWDSFDPPADGGRPAGAAIVSRPGEGERLESGGRVVLLKGILPDLCLAEWIVDGPFEGHGLHGHDDAIDEYYELDGRVLQVHAPEGGFADALRRGSG